MFKLYEQKNENYERLKHLRGSIIILDASVGAGKTTLGKHLTRFLNEQGIPTLFFEEQVHLPMLQLFLKDMNKYSFMFQIHMLSGRQLVYAEALQKAHNENKCVIIDRGYVGDYAFALMHRDAGRINEDEWNAYIDLIKSLPRPAPSKIIYLDVKPDICLERIKKRDRKGEKDSYNGDYLQKLHDAHLRAINEGGVDVKFVDWNKSRMLHDEDLLDFCDELK